MASYQGSIADDNWPLWALVTAWSTLHAFIILHMINLLFGTGFVLTCCALLSATVNTRHMGHWNRLLHGEVEKRRRRRGNFIEPTPPSPVFSAFLERVFAEHIRLSVQVLRSNSDVFGQTVLVSLFANIPINIAFVARAVFRPLPPLDKTINTVFIVGQAVMLLAALVPLAFQGRRLHYAADIPKLQMILGGGGDGGKEGDGGGGDEEEEVSRVRKSHFLNLRLKLRLMNYYTRIHTKSFKYGITIGPTATLTPETICEVKMEVWKFEIIILTTFYFIFLSPRSSPTTPPSSSTSSGWSLSTSWSCEDRLNIILHLYKALFALAASKLEVNEKPLTCVLLL